MKVILDIESTEVDTLIFGASFIKTMREDFLKDHVNDDEFVARVAIAEELVLRICTAAMTGSPIAKAFIAEHESPAFVEYKRNPIQMTSIVTSWPTETYGAVSLFDDAGNAPLRGWAEPSEIPGRPSVSLRANGESSWMSPEDARRLAAMLIAAANGINAFDPKTESDRG